MAYNLGSKRNWGDMYGCDSKTTRTKVKSYHESHSYDGPRAAYTGRSNVPVIDVSKYDAPYVSRGRSASRGRGSGEGEYQSKYVRASRSLERRVGASENAVPYPSRVADHGSYVSPRHSDGSKYQAVDSGGDLAPSAHGVFYERKYMSGDSDGDRGVDFHTRRLLDFGHISNPIVMRLRQEMKPIHNLASYTKRFTRSMSCDRAMRKAAEVDDDARWEKKRMSKRLDTAIDRALKRKYEDIYLNCDFDSNSGPIKDRSPHVNIKSMCEYDLIDGEPHRNKRFQLNRMEDPVVTRALSQTHRSSSVSNLDQISTGRYDFDTYTPHSGLRSRPRLHRAISDHNLTIHSAGADISAYGGDVGHFVTDSSVRFAPDEVEVVILPSGKKAVQYSKYSQSGHGDPGEQNQAIKRVIEKTRFMQQSMTTLEDFVRRNRTLFPEDTRIYQRIRFFLLTEQQLREIGEDPNAEVYGVKIVERLVVPYGTDVMHILQRCYNKKDFNVEYSGIKEIRGRRYSVTDDLDTSYRHLRSHAKPSHDLDTALPPIRRRPYEEIPDRHISYEDTGRKRTHLSEPYTRSPYKSPGLAYDDVYTPRGKSSYASSVTSDGDSTRSSVSGRRKKRFDTAPAFTSTLRPKRCHVGGTVKFNCSISGLPMPDLQWFRGNRVITPGGRFTISNNYGLCCLEIADVTRDDAGLYTVKGTNIEGEVSCTAALEVPDEDTGISKPEGIQRPWFTIDPMNAWAEIGNKATLEAQATGRPMPSFKWLKDNIPLPEDDHRIKYFEDERGNTKLVIKDIRETDSGLYFCVADNKAGKCKSAANLKVVPKGQLSEERRRSRSRSRETTPVGTHRRFSRETTPVFDLGPGTDKGQKPYFVQSPAPEMNVRQEDTLTLKCVVDGDPKPYVTWMKGPRELTYTEHIRIVTEGDQHILQIMKVLDTDKGEYQAVAFNPLGKVRASCFVNIGPKLPDDSDDWELKTYKMSTPDVVVETSVTTEQENVPPTFVKKLPLETHLKEHENLEIKCKTEEAPPEIHVHKEYAIKVKGDVTLEEKTHRISKGEDGEEKVTLVGTKVETIVPGDKPKEKKPEEQAPAKKEPATEAPTEPPKPIEEDAIQPKPKSDVKSAPKAEPEERAPSPEPIVSDVPKIAKKKPDDIPAAVDESPIEAVPKEDVHSSPPAVAKPAQETIEPTTQTPVEKAPEPKKKKEKKEKRRKSDTEPIKQPETETPKKEPIAPVEEKPTEETPVEKAPAPVDEKPAEKAPVPVQEKPTEEAPTPIEEKPTEKTAAPVEEKAPEVPVDEKPSEAEEKPVEEALAPVEDKPVKAAPAPEKEVPVPTDEKPVSTDETPTEESSAPSETPSEDDMKKKKKEKKEKRRKSDAEVVSVDESTTEASLPLAPVEDKPVKAAPAPEKEVPVPTDEKPVPTEETPTEESSAPSEAPSEDDMKKKKKKEKKEKRRKSDAEVVSVDESASSVAESTSASEDESKKKKKKKKKESESESEKETIKEEPKEEEPVPAKKVEPKQEPEKPKEKEPVPEEKVKPKPEPKVEEPTEPAKSPEFQSELPDTKAKLGETVKFTLTVVAHPAPDSIKWFKDGVRLEQSEHFVLVQVDTTYTLEIVSITREDIGMYSCTVANDQGLATTTCSLKVEEPELKKEPEPDQTQPSTDVVDFVDKVVTSAVEGAVEKTIESVAKVSSEEVVKSVTQSQADVVEAVAVNKAVKVKQDKVKAEPEEKEEEPSSASETESETVSESEDEPKEKPSKPESVKTVIVSEAVDTAEMKGQVSVEEDMEYTDEGAIQTNITKQVIQAIGEVTANMKEDKVDEETTSDTEDLSDGGQIRTVIVKTSTLSPDGTKTIVTRRKRYIKRVVIVNDAADIENIDFSFLGDRGLVLEKLIEDGSDGQVQTVVTKQIVSATDVDDNVILKRAVSQEDKVSEEVTSDTEDLPDGGTMRTVIKKKKIVSPDCTCIETYITRYIHRKVYVQCEAIPISADDKVDVEVTSDTEDTPQGDKIRTVVEKKTVTSPNGSVRVEKFTKRFITKKTAISGTPAVIGPDDKVSVETTSDTEDTPDGGSVRTVVEKKTITSPDGSVRVETGTKRYITRKSTGSGQLEAASGEEQVTVDTTSDTEETPEGDVIRTVTERRTITGGDGSTRTEVNKKRFVTKKSSSSGKAVALKDDDKVSVDTTSDTEETPEGDIIRTVTEKRTITSSDGSTRTEVNKKRFVTKKSSSSGKAVAVKDDDKVSVDTTSDTEETPEGDIIRTVTEKRTITSSDGSTRTEVNKKRFVTKKSSSSGKAIAITDDDNVSVETTSDTEETPEGDIIRTVTETRTITSSDGSTRTEVNKKRFVTKKGSSSSKSKSTVKSSGKAVAITDDENVSVETTSDTEETPEGDLVRTVTETRTITSSDGSTRTEVSKKRFVTKKSASSGKSKSTVKSSGKSTVVSGDDNVSIETTSDTEVKPSGEKVRTVVETRTITSPDGSVRVEKSTKRFVTKTGDAGSDSEDEGGSSKKIVKKVTVKKTKVVTSEEAGSDESNTESGSEDSESDSEASGSEAESASGAGKTT